MSREDKIFLIAMNLAALDLEESGAKDIPAAEQEEYLARAEAVLVAKENRE